MATNKKNQEIIEPKGGWKPNTWYRGICSMRKSNPKFKVLIYSGYLNKKGEPEGYSGVFSESCVPDELGDVWPINKPLYLEVTSELFTVREISV